MYSGSRAAGAQGWYNPLVWLEEVAPLFTNFYFLPAKLEAARLSIIEELAERTLTRMTPEERQALIIMVVEKMLGQMTAQERVSLMERVVDRFLEGLPGEERRDAVRELVPSLLAQLMKSGDMSVDEFLWSAIGSLGAMDTPKADDSSQAHQQTMDDRR
jgi:hypothetical protein